MAKNEDYDDLEWEDDEADEKYPVKTIKKAVNKDTDEDEELEEEFDEEFEEEEDEVKQLLQKAKKPGRPPVVNKPKPTPAPSIRTDPKKPVTTYSSYHFPERAGVKNDYTGEPIAEDVFSILALILTKLEKIEEAVY